MSLKELDALILNNTIVKMRNTINQVRYRVSNKMIRNIKVLKTKRATDSQKEANNRKIERLLNDLKEIKSLKPDDVSKSALTNTKTANQIDRLMCTSEPCDRALYRLIGHKILIESVDEFREKYPDWPTKLPFLLQRLGLQYKMKKNSKLSAKIAQKLRKGETLEDSNQSDSEGEEESTPIPSSPIKPAKSLKKKKKASSSISDPLAKKGTFEAIEKKVGTTVVRKINMNENSDEDSERDLKEEPEVIPNPLDQLPTSKPSSSFFLGGVSDSEIESTHEEGIESTTPAPKFKSQFSTSLKRKEKAQNGNVKNPKPKFVKKPNMGRGEKKTSQAERKPAKVSKSVNNEMDTSKMHPSWLAKRKIKETMQAAGEVKNKKIKF